MKKYRIIPIAEIEKDYEISKNGYLINKRSGNIIYGSKNKYGYMSIYFSNLKTSFLVHRIIACKFLYNKHEEELQINHKDLNKTNNNIDNLEWVTNKENVCHSRNNQTYNNADFVFLKDFQIIQLYKELSNGASTKEMAEKYKVSESTIMNVKYKRVYKNLLEDFSEIPKSNSSTKLTEEEIDIIRKELEAGSKPSEISKKYNIPRLVIIDFKRGKSFASQTPKTEKFLGGEKLKKCEVLEILSLYKKGYDFEQLSIKFNVCKDTIKNIIYKKTWKSLTKDIDI